MSSYNIEMSVGDIPVIVLDERCVSLLVSLNRNTETDASWPDPATTVTIVLQVSYDGGTSYLPGGSFSAKGGRALGRNGAVLAQTAVTFRYSEPITHVKGTISVTNGPLVTSLATISVN
jgi:hypothetical protein